MKGVVLLKKSRELWIRLGLISLALLVLVAYYGLQKSVTIKVDGKNIQTHTFKNTVRDVLAQQQVKLGPKDLVKPGLQTALRDDLVISVIRAIPMTVVADGQTHKLLSPPIRVADAVQLAGFKVGGHDILSADPADITKPGQVIRVVRVTERVVNLKSGIPFRKENTNDGTLEKGLSRTLRRGVPGVAQETIKITYHDGKEIRREVLQVQVLKQPVNQVVAMGTITSVSRGKLRLDFSRALLAATTAYTHTGHRTASGLQPQVGLVAVDPRVIPMGSRLYIEGYGFARAADRGRSIKGEKLDLFMETLGQCKSWGRRTAKVYVLN